MAAKRPKNPRNSEDRRLEAYRVRNRANLEAQARQHPPHETNGEEDVAELNQFTSFRKGLKHNAKGLVKAEHYTEFRRACEGLKLNAFESIPIGTTEKKFRKWESPTAGAIYDLEGPDAQAVTMPPAPELGSAELAYEMAEVYLMALVRDTDFSMYEGDDCVAEAATSLDMARKLAADELDGTRRDRKVTASNIFRGEGIGVISGPHISQFLLAGTADLNDPKGGGEQGFIEYGAQRIDQRVRTARPRLDFMQTLEKWLEVQNGAAPAINDKKLFVQPGEKLESQRFIASARDLATYVHFDQLYQAYLNACLLLISTRAAGQVGLPHSGAKKTVGFAQFGGPHILSLLTEVATRGLKAVRYQKFTQHRRARPEAIAGLISQYKDYENEKSNPFAAMKPLVDNLDCIMFKGRPLLDSVFDFNKKRKGKGYFLPMAFLEGSPMHPAYGAGHATVAGACVTTLKAFFNTDATINNIYESESDGVALRRLKGAKPLTIEGELNKLAANISIGRNMAGVHYYTDYSESVRMGEEIAIGVLEEQLYTYPEKVRMTLRRFLDGREVLLKN